MDRFDIIEKRLYLALFGRAKRAKQIGEHFECREIIKIKVKQK